MLCVDCLYNPLAELNQRNNSLRLLSKNYSNPHLQTEKKDVRILRELDKLEVG